MKAHLKAIDGLRGIFAFLVMLYHTSYWLQIPYPDWVMSTLRIWGIYGVEGFFVISGIALSLSTKSLQFNSRQGVVTFLIRRYSRILPLYALLFILYAHKLPLSLEFLMVFGFYNPAKSSLIGGWSIGVEFAFYFLFPFIVLLGKNNIYRTALLVFLAAVLLAWHTAGFDLGSKLATQNAWYVHPANHLFFFVGGYFCGVIYERVGYSLPDSFNSANCLAFSMALFLVVCVYGYNSDPIELMASSKRLVLALLVVVMVGTQMFLNIGGRLAVFLGDISYAVYLIHPLVVFKVLPHVAIDNVWIKLAIVFGISVPSAYLSHRFFEMPAQRFIRKVAHA